MKRAQSDLDLIEASHDLKLGLREKTVRVADREAKLAEREFYVCLLFALCLAKTRFTCIFNIFACLVLRS